MNTDVELSSPSSGIDGGSKVASQVKGVTERDNRVMQRVPFRGAKRGWQKSERLDDCYSQRGPVKFGSKSVVKTKKGGEGAETKFLLFEQKGFNTKKRGSCPLECKVFDKRLVLDRSVVQKEAGLSSVLRCDLSKPDLGKCLQVKVKLVDCSPVMLKISEMRDQLANACYEEDEQSDGIEAQEPVNQLVTGLIDDFQQDMVTTEIPKREQNAPQNERDRFWMDIDPSTLTSLKPSDYSDHVLYIQAVMNKEQETLDAEKRCVLNREDLNTNKEN